MTKMGVDETMMITQNGRLVFSGVQTCTLDTTIGTTHTKQHILFRPHCTKTKGEVGCHGTEESQPIERQLCCTCQRHTSLSSCDNGDHCDDSDGDDDEVVMRLVDGTPPQKSIPVPISYHDGNECCNNRERCVDTQHQLGKQAVEGWLECLDSVCQGDGNCSK